MLAGTEIAGRYVLRRPVASGGMAQVWEAEDSVLGRRVAVKLLHPHLVGDAEFVERFRREAKAAARLSHQSIVAIYDTASEDGIEAIVMELIDGMTLRAYLDEYRTLSLADATDLVRQVGAALETAHAARLVHRDIKPANIILCPDRRVKVTDFGIAKVLEEGDRTNQGTLLGTAKYLAPEQVEGAPVDERADIYALGVVLYEALSGSAPFVAENDSATALARLRVDPRPLRELDATIPPAVEQVVGRALAREREARYPSARAFVDAFTQAVDAPIPSSPEPTTVSQPPPAPEPAPVTVGPATRDRRRVLVPLLVLGAIAGSLVLGVALIAATSAGRGFVEDVIDGLSGDDDPGASARQPGSASTDAPASSDASSAGDDEGARGGDDAAESSGADGLAIVEALDFDPLGDDEERPGLVKFAIDGNPATAWASESYSNRALGNLKEGVGLVFVLEGETTLRELVVASPTIGWSARVYAADAPMGRIETWGEPLDGRTDIAGDASFDLRGVRASTVLLWITDLGDAPPRLRVEITDVTLG